MISVGKIFDIFDGEGLTESNKSKSSVHGMEQTIEIADREFTGLCFTNLVDFDALWGHRRNVAGYAHELEKFDEKLGILMEKLREDDLLIITADHGNDPTHTGTDHTREQVPFFAVFSVDERIRKTGRRRDVCESRSDDRGQFLRWKMPEGNDRNICIGKICGKERRPCTWRLHYINTNEGKNRRRGA